MGLDDATFDERTFGFGSLVDLLRACQREGLFRIERDRQGVIRLFPGNIMQPSAASIQPEDDAPSSVAVDAAEVSADATPAWGESEGTAGWTEETPPARAAESEVVEGAVLQEIEVAPVVDGETAPDAARPPRKGRSRGRGRSAADPRTARKAADAGVPRARKTPARPRARKPPA